MEVSMYMYVHNYVFSSCVAHSHFDVYMCMCVIMQ